jgi:hypothetical protein
MTFMTSRPTAKANDFYDPPTVDGLGNWLLVPDISLAKPIPHILESRPHANDIYVPPW